MLKIYFRISWELTWCKNVCTVFGKVKSSDWMKGPWHEQAETWTAVSNKAHLAFLQEQVWLFSATEVKWGHMIYKW